MADSYKDIIITPNRGNTADPKIEFRGANSSVNTSISLQTYHTSNGTLSFEGSAGQLFSITNDLSGSIFSVNDVSGIPSIEVFANGVVSLAEYSGSVGIGTTNPTEKLHVNGTIRANEFTGSNTSYYLYPEGTSYFRSAYFSDNNTTTGYVQIGEKYVYGVDAVTGGSFSIASDGTSFIIGNVGIGTESPNALLLSLIHI